MPDLDRLLSAPRLAPLPATLAPTGQADLLRALLTAARDVDRLPSIAAYVERSGPAFRHQFAFTALRAYPHDPDWQVAAFGAGDRGGHLSDLTEELGVVRSDDPDYGDRLAEHWRRRGFPFDPPLEAVVAWAEGVGRSSTLLGEIGHDTPVLEGVREPETAWRRLEDAPWVGDRRVGDRIVAKHQAIAAACRDPVALMDAILDHDPLAVVGLFENPHLGLQHKRELRDGLIRRFRAYLSGETQPEGVPRAHRRLTARLLAAYDERVEPLPADFRQQVREAAVVDGRLAPDHGPSSAEPVVKGQFAWDLFADLDVPEAELEALLDRLRDLDAPLDTFVTHPGLTDRLIRRLLEGGPDEPTAVMLALSHGTIDDPDTWPRFRALGYPSIHRMLLQRVGRRTLFRALWGELVQMGVAQAVDALEPLEQIGRIGWLTHEDLLPILSAEDADHRRGAFERLDGVGLDGPVRR